MNASFKSFEEMKVEGPSSRSNELSSSGMGWKWEVERKTGELNQLVGELVGGRWTGRSTDHLVGDGRWPTTDHVFGRWMVGDRPPTTKRGRKKSRIYVTYVRIVRNPGSCSHRSYGTQVFLLSTIDTEELLDELEDMSEESWTVRSLECIVIYCDVIRYFAYVLISK